MHIIGKYVFGKHYVVGYIFAKPCVGMRMGKMAVFVTCQSYAGLFDFRVVMTQFTFPFIPSYTVTCFPKGIWHSKLQIVLLVHTKWRGRDEGSMALD